MTKPPRFSQIHIAFLPALVAGVVFVAGCGGGGGVRPDSTNNPMVEPPSPAEPAVTTSQTTVRGTSEVDLIDYLKDNASGGPWGECPQCWQRWPQLPLWAGQPIVRVREGSKPEYHRMTAKAVDLINDWLPVEHRMIMGEPASLYSDRDPDLGYHPVQDPRDVPAGVIYVDFNTPHLGAQSRYNESGDPTRTDDVPRMISNLVVINADFFHAEQFHEVYGVLVHELVHAMGLPGHVYEGRHPTSIMPDGAYRGGGLPTEAELPRLPRIDGEALMTAYALYDDGETDADINSASLGPWAQTIPAINGEVRTDGGTARFGAEYRTQYTRVWDEGPMPATTLAASRLTGTATWAGALVGFTDGGTAVDGDAGITVDIADMDGTAAFTNLMAGSASWGPNLSTGISVNGNHIESTEGGGWVGFDAQFRGTDHEAVTGAFRWERYDTGNLTAAFGAVRE